VQTQFFDSLIDDFGIWQHTDGRKPLTREGYALDDAARGFLACTVLDRPEQMDVLFNYLKKSLHQDGLYGFAKPDHAFFNFPSSEDAFGQTIWALGTAIDHKFREPEAKSLLVQLRPRVEELSVWRGWAYALLGAIKYDPELADSLARKLIDACRGTGSTWRWPEQTMTYAIGILPVSLLVYAKAHGNSEAEKLGLEILEFADNVCRSYGQPEPIGNVGWYSRGALVPRYSQQPIEPAYMILAHTAAGQLTGDLKHYQAADEWFEWYGGRNPTEQSMIDPATGGCYDGIDIAGANTHSGAEANICYILAQWAQHSRQIV
jgi:hypothetical protein